MYTILRSIYSIIYVICVVYIEYCVFWVLNSFSFIIVLILFCGFLCVVEVGVSCDCGLAIDELDLEKYIGVGDRKSVV